MSLFVVRHNRSALRIGLVVRIAWEKDWPGSGLLPGSARKTIADARKSPPFPEKVTLQVG